MSERERNKLVYVNLLRVHFPFDTFNMRFIQGNKFPLLQRAEANVEQCTWTYIRVRMGSEPTPSFAITMLRELTKPASGLTLHPVGC